MHWLFIFEILNIPNAEIANFIKIKSITFCFMVGLRLLEGVLIHQGRCLYYTHETKVCRNETTTIKNVIESFVLTLQLKFVQPSLNL